MTLQCSAVLGFLLASPERAKDISAQASRNRTSSLHRLDEAHYSVSRLFLREEQSQSSPSCTRAMNSDVLLLHSESEEARTPLSLLHPPVFSNAHPDREVMEEVVRSPLYIPTRKSSLTTPFIVTSCFLKTFPSASKYAAASSIRRASGEPSWTPRGCKFLAPRPDVFGGRLSVADLVRLSFAFSTALSNADRINCLLWPSPWDRTFTMSPRGARGSAPAWPPSWSTAAATTIGGTSPARNLCFQRST